MNNSVSTFLFGLGLIGLIFRFITTENAAKEDAPNWKHVITSKKQEMELKAFSCSKCGYTIFPARGREGKFFPDNYKCAMCGAGREAFMDKRDEILKIHEGEEAEAVEYEKKSNYASKRGENDDDYQGDDAEESEEVSEAGMDEDDVAGGVDDDEDADQTDQDDVA
jgi:rubredoxin